MSAAPIQRTEAANFLPIWSCSVWGLPCPRHYCRGGALLPHLFTLTPASLQRLCHPERSEGSGRAARIVRVFCGRINRVIGTHPYHASLQSPYNDAEAVCFLWHFPSSGLESALPDVIRHTALRSSDFPLPAPEDAESDRPVRLPTESLYCDAGCIPRVRLSRLGLRLSASGTFWAFAAYP